MTRRSKRELERKLNSLRRGDDVTRLRVVQESDDGTLQDTDGRPVPSDSDDILVHLPEEASGY